MTTENIIAIASEFFSDNKRIKISVSNNNKIIILPSLFYSIIILHKDDNIIITSKWKYGLVGSIAFKKVKANSVETIRNLEKKYSDKNYKVSKLHIL